MARFNIKKAIIPLQLFLTSLFGSLGNDDPRNSDLPICSMCNVLGTKNAFQTPEDSYRVYLENFEEEAPFFSQSRQFADLHSFNVVADPDLGPNKVGRFELRDSDPQVKRGTRAEVGFRTVEKELWYAYSIYFPVEGYESDNTPEIISQWHQLRGGSPPNAIQVENDEIYLRSICKGNGSGIDDHLFTNYTLGKVERGKWQRFVFHLIHSPGDDGLIEIWLNGENIYNLNGPNMRKEFGLPYFKMGIYKWRWNDDSKTLTNRRILLFDDIIIGNKEASL